MQDQPRGPRRTRTRWPGVYYRDTPKGRRYEISFTDSTGRRRWRVVEGGEKDARAALEEIRGRKRRGEKIAPSRKTVAEVAADWLSEQSNLRPGSRARYASALNRHIIPRLGRKRIASIEVDHIAALIRDVREGRGPDGEAIKPLAPWSIRGVLVPLSRIFAYAMRRGYVASNVVSQLERGERPGVGRRDQRVLDRDEIARLLDAADPEYRPLLTCAVFSGLRLSELCGLVWQDVDFAAGELHVRYQLGRDGSRVEPKTPQARRDVAIFPALAKMLREHRAASRYSRDLDPVFTSSAGTPLSFRNVQRRAIGDSAQRAGLNSDGRPRLRLHDCRHTFASLLIDQGLDPVYVSRQLGHASPAITMNVYAHLFDRRKHADRSRAALEASYGALLEQTLGNARQAAGGDVVNLQAFRD
jgi:integrase